MRLAYDFQPGGLRAGSPPSPPPPSIRLIVRRLRRSPRLMGPGPREQFCSDSGGRRLSFRDLRKFRSDLSMMLLQVFRNAWIADHAREVAAN